MLASGDVVEAMPVTSDPTIMQVVHKDGRVEYPPRAVFEAVSEPVPNAAVAEDVRARVLEEAARAVERLPSEQALTDQSRRGVMIAARRIRDLAKGKP